MRTKDEILKGMEELDFLMNCRIDFKFFCEQMLGMNEFGGIHEFQLEWFYLIQNNTHTVIEAPSGFSKTEIVGVCYPLWRIWNERNLKLLLVSKTTRQAEGNLLNRIKGYIEDNEYFKELIPSGMDRTWNKEEIKLKNGCWVKNVPYSINIKGYRANLIILDEADSYDNPEIFFTHVISRIIPGGKICVISTPEGPTKLIGQIKGRNPDDFVFKKNVAIINCKDPNDLSTGESIWPERFDIFYMMKQRQSMGENSFQMNYMCNTMTEYEDTIFQISTIAACWDSTLKLNKNVNPKAQYFIGADFAISRGLRADHDAFVVIEKLGEIFTLKHIETHHGITRPMKINRLVELYETFKSDYQTKIIADESNMGTMVISDLRSLGITVIAQNFHHAERKKLLITFNNMLESGNFLIPRNSKCRDTQKYTNLLLEQLIGFKRKKSDVTGSEIFASTAAHDDVAISVAMAAKEAGKFKKMNLFGISG